MYQTTYLQRNHWRGASINRKWICFFIINLLICDLARGQDSQPGNLNDSGQVGTGQQFPKSRWSALLETRAGYQFTKAQFQKLEIYAKPEWEAQLSPKLRFKAIGRIYLDPIDKLEPGKPRQLEVSRPTRRGLIGDILEVELRELYFDLKIKNHYLTVGKQQIVWGKADGLKILDVVNPTNFREFLLDDFDNSRIPLWSVKTDIDLKKVKVQMVWIPDQTYHDIPDGNAIYYPRALFPTGPAGITVINKPLKKPDRFFRDADAGVRISSFIGGWDITFNYLYMYDDFPVAKISFSDNPAPVLQVYPVYKRHHMAGGTFSNSFGKFAVRGELGYFIDKYFSTADPAHAEGLFRSGQIMGVAGVDYSGFSNSLVSLQVFEDYVLKDFSVTGRRRAETYVSLLANHSFRNETITAEIIGVQSLHSGGGFLRPSLKYQLRSNLIVKFSGDLFYGSEDRLFGQFSKMSRIVLGVQLGI
jgi:hypothetical protein